MKKYCHPRIIRATLILLVFAFLASIAACAEIFNTPEPTASAPDNTPEPEFEVITGEELPQLTGSFKNKEDIATMDGKILFNSVFEYQPGDPEYIAQYNFNYYSRLTFANPDGSSAEYLDFSIDATHYHDGWLYFASNGNIYKMKPDFTELTTLYLSTAPIPVILDITVIGSYLVFVKDFHGSEQLCCLDMSNNSIKEIDELWLPGYECDGENLYYGVMENNVEKTVQYNIATGQKTTVADKIMHELNIRDNIFYYMDIDYDNTIYRVYKYDKNLDKTDFIYKDTFDLKSSRLFLPGIKLFDRWLLMYCDGIIGYDTITGKLYLLNDKIEKGELLSSADNLYLVQAGDIDTIHKLTFNNTGVTIGPVINKPNIEKPAYRTVKHADTEFTILEGSIPSLLNTKHNNINPYDMITIKDKIYFKAAIEKNPSGENGYDDYYLKLAEANLDGTNIKYYGELSEEVRLLYYKDGWLYMSNSEQIYKVKPDSEDTVIIYTDEIDKAIGTAFVLDGDTYFTGKGSLNKIGINGGNPSVIDNAAFLYLLDYDNCFIYYSKGTDYNKFNLFKYDTVKKEGKAVSNKVFDSSYLKIKDNCCYYTTEDSFKTNLVKHDLGTGKETIIFQGDFYDIDIFDRWVVIFNYTFPYYEIVGYDTASGKLYKLLGDLAKGRLYAADNQLFYERFLKSYNKDLEIIYPVVFNKDGSVKLGESFNFRVLPPAG